MTSNIDTSNINGNFPIQGIDNSSQGFRDNFSYIKLALDTAKNEISALSTNPTITNIVLNEYVSSELSGISPVLGQLVFVNDAPGGSQPCFYDGTNWFTMSGRIPL